MLKTFPLCKSSLFKGTWSIFFEEKLNTTFSMISVSIVQCTKYNLLDTISFHLLFKTLEIDSIPHWLHFAKTKNEDDRNKVSNIENYVVKISSSSY